MEVNVKRTKITSFTRNYYVNDVSILRTDCINDLGVILDSKLHFNCHVNFVHSQTLGLIRYITCNFSSLHSLVVLYNALIKSKLQYALVVWNNLMLTGSNKL
jgi:hypothetical protein